MKTRSRHLISVLLGVFILLGGIRGLMGMSARGFIPHELYIVFGLISIGFGLWKFMTDDENDSK